MNILIIDIDSTIPNLALKKIEKYWIDKGAKIEWNVPIMKEWADKIYVSCVFSKNRRECEYWEGNPKVEIGGSGYDLCKVLPPEIEEIKPHINWGFTSRGCIRHCEFCFIEGTNVLTNAGLKKIQDLKIGDYVLDRSGEFNRVSNVLKRKYNGDGIYFNTKFNNVPLTCTNQHSFPNSKNENIDAVDIKEDNNLIIQYPIESAKSLDVSKHIMDIGWSLNPIDKDMLTGYKLKLFCELSGWYLSEGSVTLTRKRKQSYCIQFCLSKKEMIFAKRIQEIIKILFGLKCKIYDVPYRSTLNISLSNKHLGLLFLSLFGKGSHNKYIHGDILCLKNEYIIEILKSYFKGDGSLVKLDSFYRISSASVSYSLSLSVALLLRRLGYHSILRIGKNNASVIEGRKIKSSDLYSVYIGRFNEVETLSGLFFNKKIKYNKKNGFSLQEKQDIVNKIMDDLSKNLNGIENTCVDNGIVFQTYYRWVKEINGKMESLKYIDDNYNFTKINERKKIKLNCNVYNLTVEKTHTYTVNGILTNNCIVPEKEGNVHVVGDVYDLWDGKSKEIMILDNNILALPDHFKKICYQLRKEKLKVDFNQGLDHRLLTNDIVDNLFSIKHIDQIRFAFDDLSYKRSVSNAMEMMRSHGLGDWRTRWYVYVGEKDNFETVYERLQLLRSYKQLGYLMRDDKVYDNKMYIGLSKWVNTPGAFKKELKDVMESSDDLARYKKHIPSKYL